MARMIGIIVRVSARLPSNASTINGTPRFGQQADGDLWLEAALLGEPGLAEPVTGIGLEPSAPVTVPRPS
jgi:hypothetical protein